MEAKLKVAKKKFETVSVIIIILIIITIVTSCAG